MKSNFVEIECFNSKGYDRYTVLINLDNVVSIDDNGSDGMPFHHIHVVNGNVYYMNKVNYDKLKNYIGGIE